MITINAESWEFNEIEKYLMTISPAIISIKDVDDGTKINVDGIMTFTDEKENGESAEIMSIITSDKEKQKQEETLSTALLT